MKRIFTLSAITLFISALLMGCVKESIHYGGGGGNNEDYWLSKEQGEVVYSDSYCNYFVVETYYGYTIIRANSYKPYEGDLLYGNFSSAGTRDMYNYTARTVFTGSITDYWLSYDEALDALDYYCPLYNKGVTRTFKTATKIKKK